MTEGGASDASILFIMLTDHRRHCCMSADYFFFCDIDVEFQTALLCRYTESAHNGIIRREEKDIRSNYDALIDYNSLFNHQPLKFPTCAMSESGRIHFEEVKKIFDFFGWLFVGTLLLTAAAAFYFIKKHAWLWLRIAGILCIALPAFLGLMVAVNWDYVFVTFHQLVFNNDYWLFDSSTDPIIDILPDGYFMHCAIMIFALVFVGSFLCFIFSHLLKHRSG